jgi:hypothetical protein
MTSPADPRGVVQAKTCGDGATGVNGCTEPEAVYIEFTDRRGLQLASIMCHRHAAGLRAGEDVYEEEGWSFDSRPYTVTCWRST